MQGEIALGAVGQHFDRGIRPRQPCCQPGQVPAVAALFDQRRHQRAQPRPREVHVAIGGIVGKGDLRLAQRRNELGFRNVQQRPRQPHALALGLARHRGETGDAAAAQYPHQ